MADINLTIKQIITLSFLKKGGRIHQTGRVCLLLLPTTYKGPEKSVDADIADLSSLEKAGCIEQVDCIRRGFRILHNPTYIFGITKKGEEYLATVSHLVKQD